ncbi:hypothetical protein Z517_01097 [Fonsecaea pedrosoi CBS 271.37]|uniref:Xylanolytic transcriptional activator regulatory domain-containing protein n=1 Tax=Fonsecaea pedrosoi CBS 271.37 TaxID=1442368 RepID=A0A0D2H486_9EURO|nr:uncharacterized protein Z517_01097 [Fonsecaea pedrosoi CBS 271.37]KIW85705.1 hypothetical protein Z517_01097 [Fonsecaea pedrosoi CBS 271.37]
MDLNDTDFRPTKRIKRACLNCRPLWDDDQRAAETPSKIASPGYENLLSRITSIESRLAKAAPGGNERYGASPVDSETTDVFDTLPSPEVVWAAIDSYFNYSHNQPYSFFHEPSFRQSVSDGSLPTFLLLAVLAMSVRFVHHPFFAGQQVRASQSYARACWRLIASQCLDDDLADYRHVQALTLLSICDFTACRGSAWIKIGLAARVAQVLGMMFEPHPSLPFAAQEELRRTYWSVYLLDRLATCSRGRPASLQDYSCQLQLPCHEEDFISSNPQTTLTLAQVSSQGATSEVSASSLSPLGRVIVLAAELHRTSVYIVQGYDQDDQKPPWAPQSDFSAIRARLSSLEVQLEYDRPIQEVLADYSAMHPSANARELHSVAPLIFSYALYHLCQCLLHHPFLLRRRFELSNAKFRTNFFAASVGASFKHAKILTETLQKAREAGYSTIASFLGYCALVAGSINFLHSHSDSEPDRLAAFLMSRQNVAFLKSHALMWHNSTSMANELDAFGSKASSYRDLIDPSCYHVPLTQQDLELLYRLVDYGTMSNGTHSGAPWSPSLSHSLVQSELGGSPMAFRNSMSHLDSTAQDLYLVGAISDHEASLCSLGFGSLWDL